MEQTKKSLNLPTPIAAYFAADEGDSETLSQCFIENAVVKDEGHTYKGSAAIKKWKTGASTGYEYTGRAFRVRTEGRKDYRHQPAHRELSRQPRKSSYTSSTWKEIRSRRWKLSNERWPQRR